MKETSMDKEFIKTPLQEWISAQVVADDMLWKGGFGHQMQFIRDTLTGVFSVGLEYEERQQTPMVISTHRSKSITLPVVEFSRPDMELRLVVRHNFYNWKLSVISGTPIEADFTGLFPITFPTEPEYTGNPLSSVYFEGFPEELVFGYYEPSDRKQWSAEIHGDYALWTTVYLIMKTLGVIKPHVWTTKESHTAQLKAETARWNASQVKKNT